MTQLLKPGFLVSLKTSLRGGVFYQRVDLELDTPDDVEGGEHVAKWETTRKIENVAEFTAAKKARSAASNIIRKVCTHTSFGMLCPESRTAELEAAIADAQKIVDEFNDKSEISSIRVYVLRGRIASTDEEATRAMASEVRELLEEMQSGIRRVDVEAIREAAAKAKRMGAVLDANQAQKVSAAVEAARDAAKLIVKRIATEGPEAVRAVAESMAGPIEAARFSFLELEESAVPQGAPPPINVQRAAELEIQ